MELYMKRIIKVALGVIFAILLISSGARAEENATREYMLESYDEGYILSIYQDGSPIPVKSFADARSVFLHLNSLGGRISLSFEDLSLPESVTLSGDYIISGCLTLNGGATLSIGGGQAYADGISIRLCDSSHIRVKDGDLIFSDSVIESEGDAVLLDHSSSASFVMNSGFVISSTGAALKLTEGCAYIYGGELESGGGAAIESSASLFLIGSCVVRGVNEDIFTERVIRLSRGGAAFSGECIVRYSGNFKKGYITPVFYGASRESLSGIRIFDNSGALAEISYFDYHERVDEENFGAVYMPFRIGYFVGEREVASEYLLYGDTIENKTPPEILGYDFLYWASSEEGEQYDYAKTASGDMDLYARYGLTPPSFTVSSLGFTYDGAERRLSIENISHPLINDATLGFVWYKNGERITDGGAGIGVKAVSDSGVYECEITFAYGKDRVIVRTASVEVNITPGVVKIPIIASKEYNGEVRAADIYSNKLYTVTVGGGIDAGEYPIRLELNDGDNYAFEGGGSVAYAIFEITRAQNEWTEYLSVKDTYKLLSPEPYAAAKFGEVEYLYSSTEDGEYESAPPREAGIYYCIAVVGETKNYYGLTSSPERFEISEERAIGLGIASMPKRLDYTAFDRFDPEGAEIYLTFNSGRKELIALDELVIGYASGSELHYGDNTVIISYMGISLPIPITVHKAEYDISGIELCDLSVVYNGEFNTIPYTGQLPVGYDGIALECEIVGGGVDSGEYKVAMRFLTKSRDYEIPATIERTLIITPRDAEVIFENTEFVYDGTAKTPTAYIYDAFGRKTLITVGRAYSLAGEYTVAAYYADQNYRLIGNVGEFVINKADYDLSAVEWIGTNRVYNGEETSVYAIGLPSGVSVIGYADNRATEAGVYTAKATLSYDERNYNPPPELICRWEIRKADYDISCFEFLDSEYEYDGEMKYPAFIGEMPYGKDGSMLEFSCSVGEINANGEGALVKISFYTESKNYNAPEAISRIVKITPRGVTVEWISARLVYNAKRQSPIAIAEECEVTVLSDATNAGVYIARAISNDENYCVINAEFGFEILKADNYWTEEIRISDIYQGEGIEPSAECLGGEVRFLYYQSPTGEALGFIPSEPGRYYVSAVTDGNENYNAIEGDRVPFEIIAVIPIKMTATLNKTGFVAFDNLSESDIIITLINNNGSVSVIPLSEAKVIYPLGDGFRYGDDTVEIRYGEFSIECEIEVIKKDYDLSNIRWSESEFIYDGNMHSVCITGLPDGVCVIEYYGESAKDAGVYFAGVRLSFDEWNYNAPIIDEYRYEIKKKTVDIPIIPNLVYNGEMQSPDVEESYPLIVECMEEREVGEYSVTVRLADILNYELVGGGAYADLTYRILPANVTVKISDVHKYLLSKRDEATYEIVDGVVYYDDDLKLKINYCGDEVSAESGNPNYAVTVIAGRIIRHKGLSENGAFTLFTAIFIILLLIFVIIVTVKRRKSVSAYISMIKCRLSPIHSDECEQNTESEIDEDGVSGEIGGLGVGASRADDLISDSLAKDLLHREDVIIETAGNKKRVINVDTLSESFSEGECVDVNKLKEMSLVPYDTAYIKVLARGMIDKPLKVYANDFSLVAVKMIALSGGEAIRVITVKKREKK